MTALSETYEFVFRGLLTDEALDAAGRQRHDYSDLDDQDVAEKVSLSLLNGEAVASGRRMAIVYTAICAFENSVRELVAATLIETKGDEWWAGVKTEIRNRAETRQENEERFKFHTQRGDSPLNYTELKDLLNIIRANWEAFEPYLPNIDWVTSVVEALERSRNVIMHSGTLGPRDLERIGLHIRDWVTQVGA